MQNLINSPFIRYQASSIKNRISGFLIYFLSFVLLFAGISKIIDPTSLIENLSAFGGSVFPFLPETIRSGGTILISSLLPLIEIGLGFLLIFSLHNEKIKSKNKIILIATVILFGIFFLYSIYGFVLDNELDCGCFGNVVKSSFGWGMMVRNLVFLILSITVLKRNKIH